MNAQTALKVLDTTLDEPMVKANLKSGQLADAVTAIRVLNQTLIQISQHNDSLTKELEKLKTPEKERPKA